MNQQCKVCGEPAAGFHFGAFTCEGCKSFFGRSYNNLGSISECKNQGTCVINKKNRTSCKACRLRKCLLVGMSKSGSRYGRRSNWFKIHCLLQEQQQQQQQGGAPSQQTSPGPRQKSPPPQIGLLGPHALHQHLLQQQHALARASAKEDLLLMGLDDYKHSTSPTGSSPESHNSDTSVEVGDRLSRPGFPARPVPQPPKDFFMPLPFSPLASLGGVLPHPAFLPGMPPSSFMFPPNYLYPTAKIPGRPFNNNNNESPVDIYGKRFYLDALLQSQPSPGGKRPFQDDEEETPAPQPAAQPSRAPSASPASSRLSPAQENPMDLSVKGSSSGLERDDSESGADDVLSDHESDSHPEPPEPLIDDDGEDEEVDVDIPRQPVEAPALRVIPLDLSART